MNRIYDYIYDYQGNIIIPESELNGLEDLQPGRLLIWHDEFSGDVINSKKWYAIEGRGVNNNDLAYTKATDKVTSVHGELAYRCIKNEPLPQEGVLYNSAYLQTQNIFEFRYGRIEAKIKFPTATPHHTTFWTKGVTNCKKEMGEFLPYDQSVGVSHSSSGEIDVAEYNNGSVGARAHWSPEGFDGESGAIGGNIDVLTNTPDEWHIYACEWTENDITFYVDGVQKVKWNTQNATVNGWNPLRIPHYLILNCIVSLDGNPLWDIAETHVKWVRVYAPVGVTEKIVETSIKIPETASVAVGGRHWLGIPTFAPSDPSDMTTKWLSHNTNIVECYGGMLTGISAGTTYVQATSKQGYTSLCKVTVS